MTARRSPLALPQLARLPARSRAAAAALAAVTVLGACGLGQRAVGLPNIAPATTSGGAAARSAQGGAEGALLSDSASTAPATLAAQPTAGAASDKAAAAARAATGAAPQQALPPLPSVDRMIVKTGTLTLQVTDLADAMQRVNAVVQGVPGAYVAASSSTYRAEPTPTVAGGPAGQVAGTGVVAPRPQPVPPGQSATITLKVPVDAFGDVVSRLREVGTPLSENVSTQEVTEEYVDLDSQVRNLEATEQQYLALMGRAQKIEEILPIQQRLTEVRGQIERLRGRMTLLQRRADASTITLTLVLPAAKAGQTPAGEPRAVRTLKDAAAHLAVFLQALLDVAIYAGVFLLPLVPVAGALLWWRGRRPAPSPGGAV